VSTTMRDEKSVAPTGSFFDVPKATGYSYYFYLEYGPISSKTIALTMAMAYATKPCPRNCQRKEEPDVRCLGVEACL